MTAELQAAGGAPGGGGAVRGGRRHRDGEREPGGSGPRGGLARAWPGWRGSRGLGSVPGSVPGSVLGSLRFAFKLSSGTMVRL